MTMHLSALLASHHGGWDGCVCDNPSSSCEVHQHIRAARYEDGLLVQPVTYKDGPGSRSDASEIGRAARRRILGEPG
jgi:hypothetical protein